MSPNLPEETLVSTEKSESNHGPKVKSAFRKKMTIEPFMCGSEDKRRCKIEVSSLYNLLICSYRKPTTSDLKIVDLTTGLIVQSIPSSDRFSSNKDQITADPLTGFLAPRVNAKKKLDETDNITTFASEDLKDESENYVRVITAHSSGLLKEWSLVRCHSTNFSSEQGEETDETSEYLSVSLKKTWASFHVGHISCLLLAPSSEVSLRGLLATGGSSDSIIKIWDLNKGYCTHTFKLKAGSISTMKFHSYTGRDNEVKDVLIGAGEHSNQIAIYNLISSVKLATLDGHTSPVTSLNCLSNSVDQSLDETSSSQLSGNLLVSLSRDKLLIIWSLDSMSALKKIPIFESVEDSCFINCSPHEKVLFTVGELGIVRAVDFMSGKILFTQSGKDNEQASESSTPSPLKQIALWQSTENPSKLPTVISVTSTNQLCFFKVDLNKKCLQQNHQLVGELDTVLCVKFIGPSHEHIIVASNSHLIKIYSLKHASSCQVLSSIKGQSHSDIVLSIACCPYDPYVFATTSKDNSVMIWRFWCHEVKSAKTGRVVREEFGATALLSGTGHFRSVTSVAWPSKQSTGILLTGSEDTILKAWKIPTSLHQIQPNEQIDAHKVTVMSLTSFSSVKAHDKDINCIAMSPRDVFIATGSKDKTAKLWSIDSKSKSLNLQHTLRGHRKTIWFVDFSPIDKILLTASADSTLKLWSLTDYSCIRTFSADNSDVFLVGKFISNGTQVVSASTNSLIKLWSVKEICCQLTLDPTVHEQVIAETTLAKYQAEKSRAYGESFEAFDDDMDTRIWSLDFDQKEAHFVFGTGSRVLMYGDSTQDAENTLIHEKQVKVVCDQKLRNLMKGKKYDKALSVAIKLNQPSRCLEIMREITLSSVNTQDTGKCDGLQVLTHLLQELRSDQLFFLLSNASTKWNTNSKNSLLAQVVIKVALDRLISEMVQAGDSSNADLTRVTPFVQAALPFTERHMNRINRLFTSSHFVQFLCDQGMKPLPTLTDQ